MTAARDPVRSLFGVAVALGLAALLLREIHEVRLSTQPLGVVVLIAWVAALVSILASLREVARDHRVRSLYFAVALAAGHLLAFPKLMDGAVRTVLAGFVWALLAAVVAVEFWNLVQRPARVDDELD